MAYFMIHQYIIYCEQFNPCSGLSLLIEIPVVLVMLGNVTAWHSETDLFPHAWSWAKVIGGTCILVSYPTCSACWVTVWSSSLSHISYPMNIPFYVHEFMKNIHREFSFQSCYGYEFPQWFPTMFHGDLSRSIHVPLTELWTSHPAPLTELLVTSFNTFTNNGILLDIFGGMFTYV